MKIVKSFFLIILFIFGISYSFTDVYALDLDITGKEAILYNLDDDNVIYSLNSDEVVPIASLTKIMTTIVSIELLESYYADVDSKLDEEVIVTSSVFEGLEEYSKAGFSVGDKVTYRDLLYGIMLPSGADAVMAMVLNTTSNLDDFIKLMNDKVSELGLVNTHFDNAIGMDSDYIDSDNKVGNYSTAADVAIILRYALENDIFRKIFTTLEYTTSNNLHLESTLKSYSSYIDTSYILGSKSGFTDGAGLCLASIANINDINYLLVVLGSSTSVRSSAVSDSVLIYNYFRDNYSYRNIVDEGDVILVIPVSFANIKEYNVIASSSISLYLENDISLDDIKIEYDGIDEISYGVSNGSKLGVVSFLYDGAVIYELDIYLDCDIIYYWPILICVLFVVVLFILVKLKLSKKHRRKKRKRRRK